MVKLVIMLLVLAGLMIAAPMLANNQGFVYIDTGSHVIQLSLVSMVIILILAYLAVYLLTAVIGRIFKVRKGLLSWYGNSRSDKSKKILENAISKYIEGDYAGAAALAEKGKKWSDVQYVNIILGVVANYKSGNIEASNKLFNEAQKVLSGNAEAISILRVKMYLEAGENEKALNIITSLRRTGKPSKMISSLYYKCLERMGKFNEIVENRKEFLSNGLLSDDSYRRYVSEKIVEQIKGANDRYVVDQMFNDLPDDICDNIDVSNAFALAYNRFGEEVKAEKIIMRSLKSTVDSSRIYNNLSQWNTANHKLTEYFEKKLKKNESEHLNNTDLMSALANMYMNMNEYEKAVDLYEKLVTSAPCSDYFSRLAQCYQRLGGYQKAAMYYKQAQNDD